MAFLLFDGIVAQTVLQHNLLFGRGTLTYIGILILVLLILYFELMMLL